MTTEAQENENETDQAGTGETGTETSTSEGTENAGGASEGDAFDASSYEESFGLPAGTLSGVEDAEAALEAVREYTDKTLTAGLLSARRCCPPEGRRYNGS